MIVQTNVNLQAYNTFGFEAFADQLWTIETLNNVVDLQQILPESLILGGGSNVLLSHANYPKIVLNRIDHIRITKEYPTEVIVEIGSGKNWHETVMWALAQDLGGIENLALIPGTVGAAPIQNIGAYGVELKDVFVGLDFFDYDLKQWRYLSNKQCQLGYRDSLFKRQWKGKGFIGQIYLKLTRRNHHHINLSYAALKTTIASKNIAHPTIQQIAETVIEIRQSKLPDWKVLGNAGSFFKNPVISDHHFQDLQQSFSNIPHYVVDDKKIKIPAAWLIQTCGFKGKRMGNVGCYEKQPLVLVHFGQGKATEIINLKNQIQAAVQEKFGIQLQPEVNII